MRSLNIHVPSKINWMKIPNSGKLRPGVWCILYNDTQNKIFPLTPFGFLHNLAHSHCRESAVRFNLRIHNRATVPQGDSSRPITSYRDGASSSAPAVVPLVFHPSVSAAEERLLTILVEEARGLFICGIFDGAKDSP